MTSPEVADLTGILPVNTSLWAIAAGYLGLFSVLLIPAPISVIASAIAFHRLRRTPGVRGWVRATVGMGMGLLFSAILVMVLAAGASQGP